jgi:hypothetical protein
MTPSFRARMEAGGDYDAVYKKMLDLQPTREMVVTEDIAPIVVYPASDESKIATGQFFVVDGGWTKAKLIRDLCVASGIPMTIEDTSGGDITTATIAHLARPTPEKFCFSATDLNSYGTLDIASGAPKRGNGKMTAADRLGLGIEPDFDVLGEVVPSYC